MRTGFLTINGFINDVFKMRKYQKIGHNIMKRIRLEKKVDENLEILMSEKAEIDKQMGLERRSK